MQSLVVTHQRLKVDNWKRLILTLFTPLDLVLSLKVKFAVKILFVNRVKILRGLLQKAFLARAANELIRLYSGL